VCGHRIDIDSDNKLILEGLVNAFIRAINEMKSEDDWRNALYILSPLAMNVLFKLGVGEICFANYYECLIQPSNIATYKKMIQGFDGYCNIGNININSDSKIIANIGQKSDLIWSVFYEYFVNQDLENGTITHVYENHERILSIQLYDVENKSIEEIHEIVHKILLNISLEYGMDFDIVKLDEKYKEEGVAQQYELDFLSDDYEYVPSLYMEAALKAQDTRLGFLSFYQVIEYFFVRAQNYSFLNEYQNFTSEPFAHNELRKILKHHMNSQKELESLKLVLKKAITVNDFKMWLTACGNAVHYTNGAYKIDVTKGDDKIISALANRIYFYRCSIAHAKGDADEFIAIPLLKDEEIKIEIPLMKYVAQKVLSECSGW
jgi:hypothetical protein